MSREITFRIDSWTPETIPMERLGEYLVELGRLYGESASVHFKRLKKGSTVIVSAVAEPAVPKVERRLAQARQIQAPADVVRIYRRIDQMLAEDNAVGVVRFGRGNVVPFPGREREMPVDYGVVREEGFIEGELVRLGGIDKSVHLQLQDGDTLYTNVVTNRETARELGKLIFGPIIRLWGTGAWRRSAEGGWALDSFKVGRFEVLSEQDLTEVIADLQAVPGNSWHLEQDPIDALLRMRAGEPPAARKRSQ
ncbi:hypothetical protein [Enterovirga aerilata]|uniref:Uncharacterized protein n=1 Tax=Enterovirga aerilata TaxID=2730920 RepID=A0A849I5V0_9HYPH|nr:hypothetical protein [Enterovirga sp. DB1703]NNM71417.1 hypothetical protein [Enterovirga sp. DB1703]